MRAASPTVPHGASRGPILVAPSDQEAEDYIYDPKRATHAYFNYLITLLKSTKATNLIRPRAEMTDDEVTADAVVDEVVIAGSPSTVAEKLLAYPRRGRAVRDAADLRDGLGGGERRRGEAFDGLARARVMPRVRSALGSKAA